MALALAGGDVQALQQCIGPGQWQDEAWLRQPWSLVDETLGEPDEVGIVEGSEVPQQGEPAVGVARQWCGRLGQVEHCQAGGAPPMPAAKGIRGSTGGGLYPRPGSMRRTVSGGTNVGSPRTLRSRPSRRWPWKCCRRWCRPARGAFPG